MAIPIPTVVAAKVSLSPRKDGKSRAKAMVRFVVGGPDVLKADHLQRRQQIVSMQPAMLIAHSAAEGLVVLGVYIALPIGAHVDPVKLMSLVILSYVGRRGSAAAGMAGPS